jgi:formylglycine-generating enzyme required for sulfatase activity
MKKAIFTMFFLVAAFSVPAQSVTEDMFRVEQLADNTLRITNFWGDVENLVIPSTISGLRVTEIGSTAFTRRGIISVVIPDTVTVIGERAFCSNSLSPRVNPRSGDPRGTLTRVTIGRGVRTIGDFAFNNNPGLTEITIPDSVTSIGQGVFSHCGLTRITWGRGLEFIESAAFYGNRLTNVTIPASLKRLDGNIFRGNLIESVTIQNNSVRLFRNENDGVFRGNPITRATLMANITNDDMWFYGFEASLVNFYASQNRAAGTYVKNGQIWTRSTATSTAPANNAPAATAPATGGISTTGTTTGTVPVNPAPANRAVSMVPIQGGTFNMGSPENEPGRFNNEMQRQVTVSSFSIGRYPVTVGEFSRFINATGYLTDEEKSSTASYVTVDNQTVQRTDASWHNPYIEQNDNHPVVFVSWLDAIYYSNWLSTQEGLTPAYTINGTNVTWNRGTNGYRLPTEAEWEYACRAGTTTAYNIGASITANQANFGNNLRRTTPVGNYAPNAWGLYDMHGNVEEWCWDIFSQYDNAGGNINPTGAVSGSERVARGLSWNAHLNYTRSAARGFSFPDATGSSNKRGFRLVRS